MAVAVANVSADLALSEDGVAGDDGPGVVHVGDRVEDVAARAIDNDQLCALL